MSKDKKDKSLERLINAIHSSGLKKSFLAKEVNLSSSELSFLLHGKREYPAEKAQLLAYFGLSDQN